MFGDHCTSVKYHCSVGVHTAICWSWFVSAAESVNYALLTDLPNPHENSILHFNMSAWHFYQIAVLIFEQFQLVQSNGNEIISILTGNEWKVGGQLRPRRDATASTMGTHVNEELHTVQVFVRRINNACRALKTDETMTSCKRTYRKVYCTIQTSLCSTFISMPVRICTDVLWFWFLNKITEK